MIEQPNPPEQLRQMVENPLWYREFQTWSRRHELGAGAVALTRAANPINRIKKKREELAIIP